MEFKNEINRIYNKIQNGIVLFTGAGFSIDCKDINGRNLPLGGKLSEELWNLANLGEFDPSTSLKDIFHILKKKNPKSLYDFLKIRFSIKESDIPVYLKRFSKFPWERIYTLNIDDFWQKSQAHFNTDLKINTLSSTEKFQKVRGKKNELDLIYLNGFLNDSLDDIIFSEEDYGYTLNKENTYFNEFSSLFLTKMTIFIGSQLEESTLWKYITMRIPTIRKNHGDKELRPESYYVSPQLTKARQMVLNDYNITWLPLTAEEFSNKILFNLEEEALRVSDIRIKGVSDISTQISSIVVSNKIAEKNSNYDFKQLLFGLNPRWEDIVKQNLITRELELEIQNYVDIKLANPALFFAESEVLIVSGTAGDGKTAALMNFAYKYSNKGNTILWISSEDDINHYSFKKFITANGTTDFLIIDDADIYNESIFESIKELYQLKLCKLVILIYRSGKWIGLSEKSKKYQIQTKEFFSKRLNIREIKELISLLTNRNVLGKLIPLSEHERIDLIQSKQNADGQLIVAMIEATSGIKFDQIIADEFTNLDPISKQIYGILAITTHLRLGLNDAELTLCVENPSNEYLNALETLIKSNLVIKKKNLYYLRHRIVASKVLDEISQINASLTFYKKLMFLTAVFYKNIKNDQKKLRILRKFCLNHRRLLDFAKKHDVFHYFSELEPFLYSDYHYWLQRGSLYLELSMLNEAESFLLNSLEINSSDFMVQVQYSYLKLRKSITIGDIEESKNLFFEAKNHLVTMIEKRGKDDPYPYHILISQGQKFLVRNILDNFISSAIKTELKSLLDQGTEYHPTDAALKELKVDYYKFYFK